MNAAWFLGVAADQASPSAAAVPLSLPAWRIALLLLLIGLLLAAWWWVNRGRLSLRNILQPGTQRVFFREQRWLNSRTVVCLVEVDGERFLLAQGQGTLAWQPLGKGTSPAEAKT